MNHVTVAENEDSVWRGLYKIGGATALLAAILLPIEVIVFGVLGQPPSTITPSTVADTFTLFHNNKLLGLLEFDLLGIVIYILLVPTLLALYAALRRASASVTAIGTIFFFIGITIYFASNTIFCMLYLSDQYAAAITDAQRSMFLAAGQVLLTVFTITAFSFSYVMVSASLLIVAAVMLRSAIFSRVTAYVGILANMLAVGSIAVGSTPLPFSLMVGGLLSLISIVPLLIWFALIGRRLFQLGSGVPSTQQR